MRQKHTIMHTTQQPYYTMKLRMSVCEPLSPEEAEAYYDKDDCMLRSSDGNSSNNGTSAYGYTSTALSSPKSSTVVRRNKISNVPVDTSAANLGTSHPADVSYIDYVLMTDNIDMSQFSLKSYRTHLGNNNNSRRKGIQYDHVVTYRDEIIWTLKTSCKEEMDSRLSGVVSTCTIIPAPSDDDTDKYLLIRVSKKAYSTSRRCTRHEIEYRKVRLLDILRRSSIAYEKEMS